MCSVTIPIGLHSHCCLFVREQMGQIIDIDGNVSSSPDPPILTAQVGLTNATSVRGLHGCTVTLEGVCTRTLG